MLTQMNDFTFSHQDQVDAIYQMFTSAQIKEMFDSRGDELRTFINNLVTTLNSSSGATNVALTPITDFSGSNVQTVLQSIHDILKSKIDSSSGADFIGATSITGIIGDTIQAILEGLKSYIDDLNSDRKEDLEAHKTSGDHDNRYTKSSDLTANTGATLVKASNGNTVQVELDNKVNQGGNFTGTWNGITPDTSTIAVNSELLNARRDNINNTNYANLGARLDNTTSQLADIEKKQAYFIGVSDGNYTTGAGTDNSTLLQNSINALATNGGGVLRIPHGIYKLSTAITIPSGVSIIGDGKWSTILFCPITFSSANGLIQINGSGGNPTNFRGIGVLVQSGGCSGNGIVSTKNGTFISDIWVNGFYDGVKLNATDNFLNDFVIEMCGVHGLSIGASNINISNGTLYSCPIGFSTLNSADAESGEVILSNIRANACQQIGFEVANNSKYITFSGCSASNIDVNKFSVAGFNLDTCNNVKLVGCEANIANGQHTTAYGIRVQNSTDVIINGCKIKKWKTGVYCYNSSLVKISGCISSQNLKYGIYVTYGDRVSISDNTCFSNGDNLGDNAGIYSNNDSGYALHSITNNICAQNGGGNQDFGIYASVTNNGGASGFTTLVGNTCKYNNTSNISKNGLTANITDVGNAQ